MSRLLYSDVYVGCLAVTDTPVAGIPLYPRSGFERDRPDEPVARIRGGEIVVVIGMNKTNTRARILTCTGASGWLSVSFLILAEEYNGN